MDYLYENLGPERFQEFCSVLISKEFPHAQAFPIGQPDGGRDTLVYTMIDPKKGFKVFQVKFVRNPESIKDPHKWLVETIEGEVEKVNRLIPRGAEAYYLLTNVKGTGHLDSGSKDKMNKVLEDNIKIPSICWWREDISMLFEKDPIFKWSFPEILNGQDILNSGLFDYLNENKERRETVIRSYLADQYNQDQEVKFRQIDLQNNLLDLFTDVPIRVKKINDKNSVLRNTLFGFESRSYRVREPDEILYFDHSLRIRAAAFLLHSKTQSGIQRILLEGGPGQGKSTIAQYVCQVHRARLLDKSADMSAMIDEVKTTPIRLPIKIDLRHIAAWVENKNPYQGVLNDENFTSLWNKSLESFLVGHIFYHSKIAEFTSIDFIAICKLSPMLFIFDGFDEIANFEVRKEVIEFINKGINRISENSKSLQVIITSRPSVFSDSVGFAIDAYPHFELTSITPEVTKEYVSKWIKANRLDSKEASNIKRLVNEKLEMPHLKELAKSPMQLAIFISLLRTKGESLPNKRTALYDSYIDLLFDRESEKSSLIRDHRDLIIDIHQYLAWVLHSEAELYNKNGSIRVEDLTELLKSYLLKEGHKTDIAKLFDVVKDRVCALASRVQGTYEFEVQPLREYFCAKYLYKTSPYSPTGKEMPGTLPDRFDGISRNLYWQNVVRFFAGCFSKGELSMLIQKLKELQEDKLLKYTNYPRLLTAQMLSDYVFTQYPILLNEVVKIILDGINIGNIINQEENRSNNDTIILPSDCGRTEIVFECFKELRKFPSNHFANELIGIIKNNPDKTIELWCDYLPELSGELLTKWLQNAYLLQILHKIDPAILDKILREGNIVETIRRIQIIINGNREDVIINDPTFKKIFLEGILDSRIYYRPKRNNRISLEFLALIFSNSQLTSLFDKEFSNCSLIEHISQRSRQKGSEVDIQALTDFNLTDEIDSKIKNFLDLIRSTLETDINKFKIQLDPWNSIVESGRSIFNDCWSLNILANISASIKEKEEKLEGFDELHDSKLSLCKRVRSARLKSGNIRYWEHQLQNSDDILFTLLVFFTWATPKTIISQIPVILKIFSSLEKLELYKLFNGIHKSTTTSIFNKTQQEYVREYLKANKVSDSIIYIFSIRFKYSDRIQLIYDNIKDYSDVLEGAKYLKLDHLIRMYLADVENEDILKQIKNLYQELESFSNYYFKRAYQEEIKIPLNIAREIMGNCKSYPGGIVSLAEKACRMFAYANLKPVGEVAKEEKWFNNDYILNR